MPSIQLNSSHITTERLIPMVEATTKAAAVAATIPITKTTSTIITNLSAASSHGQTKRPTINIYPTGSFHFLQFFFNFFFDLDYSVIFLIQCFPSFYLIRLQWHLNQSLYRLYRVYLDFHCWHCW